jgi:hypothetical protein
MIGDCPATTRQMSGILAWLGLLRAGPHRQALRMGKGAQMPPTISSSG